MRFFICLASLALLSCSSRYADLPKWDEPEYRFALDTILHRSETRIFLKKNNTDSIEILVSDSLICSEIGGFMQDVLAWKFDGDNAKIQHVRDSLKRAGVDIEDNVSCKGRISPALRNLSTVTDSERILFFSDVNRTALPDYQIVTATLFRNRHGEKAFNKIETSYLEYILIFDDRNFLKKMFVYPGDY